MKSKHNGWLRKSQNVPFFNTVTIAYSFKEFRKLQNNAFSPLVIAMHANNLRMLLSQAMHF